MIKNKHLKNPTLPQFYKDLMIRFWTKINVGKSLPILFAITVATSFAFLLPMGTPPNALIYEKAQISIKEMAKNGMVLNVMAIALISVFTIFVSIPFFS